MKNDSRNTVKLFYAKKCLKNTQLSKTDKILKIGHFAMAMYMLRPYIVRLYIVRQSVYLGLNFKVPKTQKGNLGPH